jgi:hypothetical protein
MSRIPATEFPDRGPNRESAGVVRIDAEGRHPTKRRKASSARNPLSGRKGRRQPGFEVEKAPGKAVGDDGSGDMESGE